MIRLNCGLAVGRDGVFGVDDDNVLICENIGDRSAEIQLIAAAITQQNRQIIIYSIRLRRVLLTVALY